MGVDVLELLGVERLVDLAAYPAEPLVDQLGLAEPAIGEGMEKRASEPSRVNVGNAGSTVTTR